jgi:hypothetical protein
MGVVQGSSYGYGDGPGQPLFRRRSLLSALQVLVLPPTAKTFALHIYVIYTGVLGG